MATIIKDLGPVSAYAYAVTQGYTGTEEEFAQEMADLAAISAEAETLEPDEEATASYEGGVISLGIPKGDKGDTGETGATGATGATGTGIASIAKTGTSGLVDTYTITFTDGTTTTFDVTNGAEAIDATLSIAGRAADAKATGDAVNDLKSDLTTKADATDMLKAFPIDTASGAVASFSDGANVPVKSLVVNIDPVQEGSGDPSPDNVRPISGWSEVNVQRTGENLFPYKDIESQTKNGVTVTVEKSDGIITNIHLQGTATTAFSIPFYTNGEDDQWVLPKGDCKLYIGGDKPTRGQIFDINIRKAGETSDISAASTVRTITLSEQTTFRSAYIWIYSGAVLNHNIIPVIVQSEVDTSVKYPITQRQSITIDLDQTVYGGTLDVVSGVLTVTHGEIDSYAGETLPSVWISDRDVYAEGTTPTTDAQVVYELGSPQTYQLTPVEVKTLLGLNNVWADTGDVEVQYRADTKLYIDGKGTDWAKLIAPTEAAYTATRAYTSGSLLIVGSQLYKATASIANGATLTVGTNITATTLAEVIAAL